MPTSTLLISSHSRTRPPPEKLLPSLQSKLRKLILRSASADITLQDPVVKAVYLGNLVTTWAKGEGCLDRPAMSLWKNHVQRHASIRMTVVVTPGGLKAETREHGLTEYWNNRLTWCGVPLDFPKLFCWIYRHETRKLKQELRCHAVICSSREEAAVLSEALRYRLAESLFDFRKEKLQRQNARLSNLALNSFHANGYVYAQDSSQSLNNYRRERPSPSKLSIIEESAEEDLYSPTLRATYDQMFHYLSLRAQGHGSRYKSHPLPNSLTSSNASSETENETEPEVSDSSSENSEDEAATATVAVVAAATALPVANLSPTLTSKSNINNNNNNNNTTTTSLRSKLLRDNLNSSLNNQSLHLKDHQGRFFEEICYDI